MEYMLEDPETRMIISYLEGIKDGKQFFRLADRGLELGKPIVALKVGRSEVGQKAASSHTASLTGSDAVCDAFFRQKGIIRANDIEDMIDVAALKGVKSMAKGEVITVADVEACINKAGIAGIKEGDAVIFNTGWGHHWKNPDVFNAGEPGIGIELAKYLIKKNVSMVGSDTWAVDAIPGEYENLAFELHQLMQAVNGIWYIENLDTEIMEQMARDGVYEFMWIYNPVRFMGATGSPGDPLAIR